jgi:uncharacterized protein (TIGR02594 family)
MSRIVIFTDVPDAKVDRLVEEIELDGGTASKEKQDDGRWTVTATYPDQAEAAVAESEKRLAAAGKAAMAPLTERTNGSEPFWLQIARGEMGQTEIQGPRNNPRILEYHNSVAGNIKSDEVPWCSSFVNFCISSAGVVGTNSAAARSWLNWGKSATNPKLGDIAVFSRGAPPSGHVGFYVGETDAFVLVLGGNQGNAVSIARYPKDRLLAIRTAK